MKKFLSILIVSISLSLCAYAAEGETFMFEGVQYRIIADGRPANVYKVAVNHYDTSYVVIPDSVPHQGYMYQVAQTLSFQAENCALMHYTKVDYSRVQCDFSSINQNFGSDVDVDTLILPPNSGEITVGRYMFPEVCNAMMPGIRYITLSGASPTMFLREGDDFRFSLQSLDISAYPCTKIDSVIPNGFRPTDISRGYVNLGNFPRLESVVLPNTIKSFPFGLTIGSESLSYLTIPDSLEYIETAAFGNIAMESLHLGSKVKTLEPGWASEWLKLKYIQVDPNNPYFASDDYGCLLSKDLHVLYRYPIGNEEETYELPIYVDTIGLSSFSLFSDYRFGSKYCWPIPSSVEPCFPVLNEWRDRVSLREVKLHSNVRCIMSQAFFGSSIRQIHSTEGINTDFSFSAVESIYPMAFTNSLLETISFPASLRYLGPYYLCQDYRYGVGVPGAGEIFLPGWEQDSRHVKNWYYTGWVFSGCPNLSSVVFDKAVNLEYIGGACFAGCPNLDSLNLLPCKLLHDVPPGICYLDSALTYVALPHEVEYIGFSAFNGCTSLQKIVCPAAIPVPVLPSVFNGVNKQTCELSVPAASIPLYRNAPVWQEFFNITSNGLIAVAVTSNDTTMGTVHGGGGYDLGDNTTLSAMPNEGYEFVGWSDGNTDNPRVVQVTEDSTIVAIFQYIEYHIDVRPNDTTLGTVSGGGYYHLHDTVQLVASIPYNARFTGWSDGFRYPMRDLVVTQDCTLIANFEHYYAGPNTIWVTVQSEDPAKGFAIGGGTYALGDTAAIAGIANEGYVFKGWDDGGVKNPRPVPLTQDTLFVALFRLEADTADTMATPLYPLTAIPCDSTMGSVSGSGRYEEGTEVEITATPFEGYRITGWNIELTVEPTLIFTMPDRPVTIIAYFEPIDDALPATPADPNDPDASAPSYNILGQPVDDTYHGIVIRNGKKVLQ